MAVVGLQPIRLLDATLSIAADDFTAAVGEATFTPEADYEWLPQGFGRHSTPVLAGVRWVLMLGYAQDLETAASLTRYLQDHAGETVGAALAPVSGGATVTADVLIVPGQIGGRAEDGTLTGNATLPLDGAPVLS